MPMTGSMTARSHHLIPVLLLAALVGVLTTNAIGAAEPKDDWRCAQAPDTGRWSCARDGVTADAMLGTKTTTVPQETSTPLPDIQSEAIAPVASSSGEPLNAQAGMPIESVAADAVAPVETPLTDDVPTAAELPPVQAAVEAEQTPTTSTAEPEVTVIPEEEVPVTEALPDLDATPDTEPAPVAVTVDPNAPDFQRLAYVPDQPTSLLDLPGEFWVAQIMAVSSKEFLEAYAEEHNLRGLSAARIASGDRLFFVLILGIYETKDRAQQAITNMPPPYHKYKPLLRTLASLQQAMRKADQMTGTADF
jgi:septal ring-binding cell division protein DamX